VAACGPSGRATQAVAFVHRPSQTEGTGETGARGMCRCTHAHRCEEHKMPMTMPCCICDMRDCHIHPLIADAKRGLACSIGERAQLRERRRRWRRAAECVGKLLAFARVDAEREVQ